jgi:hypothetical protein
MDIYIPIHIYIYTWIWTYEYRTSHGKLHVIQNFAFVVNGISYTRLMIQQM